MARTIKLDTVTHPSNSGTANQVLNASGQTTMPTVDINGGAIDNTIIGASTKAAGSFTTLTCSSLAPATGEALVLKEDGGAASITVDTGGSVTLANNITISGNSTIGDASGDTMTINATADGYNNRSGITGEIRMFSIATPPTGWLVCNGSAVNTYTYRVLHAVVSSTYGGTACNGGVTDQSGAVTTFNLPDFQGRTAIGVNAAAQDEVDGAYQRGIKALAGTGGADTHKLTEGETASHAHTQQGSVTNSGSQTTNASELPHSHVFPGDAQLSLADGAEWTSRPVATFEYDATSASAGAGRIYKTSDEDAHTHTIDGHAHTMEGATTAAGSDNYHNNLQPYLTVVYIIKT